MKENYIVYVTHRELINKYNEINGSNNTNKSFRGTLNRLFRKGLVSRDIVNKKYNYLLTLEGLITSHKIAKFYDENYL